MSKYILELGDSAKKVVAIYLDEGAVWTGVQVVEDLEVLNSDYINEHFGDLQDTAYKKGFEDGKAVHDKGCEGCKYANVAGTHEPCVRCSNSYGNKWTAKDDKIEVGDEVTYKSDSITWTAVVTQNVDGILTLMGETGAIAEGYDEKCYVKTGRHFDIQSILEAMKHD